MPHTDWREMELWPSHAIYKEVIMVLQAIRILHFPNLYRVVQIVLQANATMMQHCLQYGISSVKASI